jgi:hypothetical protein
MSAADHGMRACALPGSRCALYRDFSRFGNTNLIQRVFMMSRPAITFACAGVNRTRHDCVAIPLRAGNCGGNDAIVTVTNFLVTIVMVVGGGLAARLRRGAGG